MRTVLTLSLLASLAAAACQGSPDCGNWSRDDLLQLGDSTQVAVKVEPGGSLDKVLVNGVPYRAPTVIKQTTSGPVSGYFVRQAPGTYKSVVRNVGGHLILELPSDDVTLDGPLLCD